MRPLSSLRWPGATRRGRWLLASLGVGAAVVIWVVFALPAIQHAHMGSASTPEILRITRAHTGDTRLVLLAGRRLLSLGHAQDAISLLSGLLSRGTTASDTDRASLQGLLAEAEVLAGHTSSGMAHARSAINLDPGCVPAAAALAFWSERLAKWSDASAQLEKVVLAAPDDGMARYHLAWVLLRQGEYSRAEKVARAAMKQEPSNYDYRVILATSQTYRGQFREAIQIFRQALRLRPSSFTARANVVRASAFAARTEAECRQQEEPMSQLLRNDPDPDLDHEILGLLELHAGDTVAAQGHLETAARAYRRRSLSIRFLAPEIFRNLIFVHTLNGQDDQAARDIKEADAFLGPLRVMDRLRNRVEQDPGDPVLHLQLARLYETLDSLSDALNQYEDLLRLNANEARSRIDALSARPDLPDPDTEWAWRVLSTETGLRMPSKQSQS